jgi:NAD(P)-dependent dehydrogenase (short-subunit alcohol dehydrogenase family)
MAVTRSSVGRFTGRGAVITGGASGLGRACAERLLAEGAKVVVFDRDAPPPDAFTEVADQVLAIRGDVTREADVAAMVEEATAFLGRIDVLINNAGIATETPFLDTSLDEWRRTLEVNLTGMYLVGQAVARRMTADGRGGAIVLTSSTNGLVGERDYAAYNASKGGVTLLAKSMALDLAPAGIRVNAVCPGYITTPMSAAIDDPEFVDHYVQQFIPLGRTGTPEDIAAAFAFLASDEASFVTGTTLVVDGGQLAF